MSNSNDEYEAMRVVLGQAMELLAGYALCGPSSDGSHDALCTICGQHGSDSDTIIHLPDCIFSDPAARTSRAVYLAEREVIREVLSAPRNYDLDYVYLCIDVIDALDAARAQEESYE